MTASTRPGAPARRMQSNVRWILFGNSVYAAGQWLQFVIFARLGGPVAVGAYAFALALTAPVMMLSYLQLRTLMASDATSTYQFREYWYVRVATTAGALLVLAVIEVVAGRDRSAWSILVPVCAMRAADALSDIYYAIWQRHERMAVIAWGMVLNTVSSLVFMATAALLGAGAAGAAVGAALGSCAALVFVYVRTSFDAELRDEVAPRAAPLAWRRLSRLAVDATPLGVIVLLGSLQQNVPRYFVQHHAGQAALGVFAAASQLTAAGTIVVGALGSAAMPRLALLCAGGDAAAFRALARKLALAGALLGAAAVAFFSLVGRPLIVFLYRPEFGSGYHMLVVLSAAAGMGFVATLLGYALTAARVIAIQPVLLSVTLGVIVACCAVLVPRYGALGASWALVAASTVQTLWSAAALNRSRLAASPETQAIPEA